MNVGDTIYYVVNDAAKEGKILFKGKKFIIVEGYGIEQSLRADQIYATKELALEAIIAGLGERLSKSIYPKTLPKEDGPKPWPKRKSPYNEHWWSTKDLTQYTNAELGS